jgi:hypothetical protein
LLENQEIQEVQENKNAVTDLNSASIIFKKMKFVDGEIQKIKEQALKERADVDEWEQSEIKSLEGKRNYYAGLIDYYYKEQRHFNSKFKLSTPWGKVNARKSKKYFYEDVPAAIKYFEENGFDCIETEKKLKKDEYKRLFPNGVNLETGELIPGIRVEEIETFSITTTKEK